MTVTLHEVRAAYDESTNRFQHTFNLEYVLDGRTYVLRIKAADWGHAEQHLSAIIQGGRVAGEVVMEEK